MLTPADRLVSHHADTGMYVPPELAMFAELFRKKITDWEIGDETEVLPLGAGFWVPDFRLVHKESGQIVLLEVLGFWRRSAPSSTWNDSANTPRNPSCWRFPTNSVWTRPNWKGCPPGSIASATCRCPKRSPGWRRS